MRRRTHGIPSYGGWLLATALVLAPTSPLLAQARTVRLDGGQWWTGRTFEPRTMFSIEGILSRTEPERVDSVIHLDGLYVLPPFAEAHTHTLAYVPSRVTEFLRAGIFYAMVMNVDRSAMVRNAAWFNRATSVDITYTVAGVTEDNAHPIQIGLRNGRTAEALDGDWVTLIESEADLEKKWPRLRDANTDFIKLFLLSSEQYQARRADPAIPPRFRGMNPDLVPALVKKAHAAGLRVAAHVRSSHDFSVAIGAGVDVIAHLPGFSMGPFEMADISDESRMDEARHPERFRIREDDARAAAALGTTVITTIGGVSPPPSGGDPRQRERLVNALRARHDVLAHNLTLLRDAGVRIAIGSDAGEGTSVGEALSVLELGVFSPAEILSMLTEHATRVAFPRRSVGRLREGYEASFIALASNPLQDLGAIQHIRVRFKQGRILHVAESP